MPPCKFVASVAAAFLLSTCAHAASLPHLGAPTGSEWAPSLSEASSLHPSWIDPEAHPWETSSTLSSYRSGRPAIGSVRTTKTGVTKVLVKVPGARKSTWRKVDEDSAQPDRATLKRLAARRIRDRKVAARSGLAGPEFHKAGRAAYTLPLDRPLSQREKHYLWRRRAQLRNFLDATEKTDPVLAAKLRESGSKGGEAAVQSHPYIEDTHGFTQEQIASLYRGDFKIRFNPLKLSGARVKSILQESRAQDSKAALEKEAAVDGAQEGSASAHDSEAIRFHDTSGKVQALSLFKEKLRRRAEKKARLEAERAQTASSLSVSEGVGEPVHGP